MKLYLSLLFSQASAEYPVPSTASARICNCSRLASEKQSTISLEVLKEIVRVAIEQKDIEWPMSCYEDAKRLQQDLKSY